MYVSLFSVPFEWLLSRTEDKERGAGIVEYLLLVIFIAVVLIVSLRFFSGALSDSFSDAANSVIP